MYDRKIDDKTYTLRVSGLLWNDSLVMNDLETGSEWSHLGGKAMAGPMKDTRLEIIPSVICSWRRWKTEHPETTVTVFSRTADEFKATVLATSKWFLVGLRHRDAVVGYPLPAVIREAVINDDVGGDPVVVLHDPSGRGVTIFRRTLTDGAVLKFSVETGAIRGGGSAWNRTTGKALDGPLKGQQLEPLPAILSFADSWRVFHPQGRIYGAKAGGARGQSSRRGK